MIGTSPPGPLKCGSTTWRRKPAAAAASNAFPPPSSTLMPAADASQWVDATMPKSPFSSGLVVNIDFLAVTGDTVLPLNFNGAHAWTQIDLARLGCAVRH